MVVIMAPQGQLATGIGQGKKDFHVQALIAQPAVEALDIAVFDRLARTDEVQVHSVVIGPQIHRLTCELGSVIDGDRLRRASQSNDWVERRSDLLSAQRGIGMQGQALAGELIDDRKHPDPAAVGQPLSDEIHAPLVVGTHGLSESGTRCRWARCLRF